MGPTLVAMATKFGLGAEIQSPTGLYGFVFANVDLAGGTVPLGILSINIRVILDLGPQLHQIQNPATFWKSNHRD